MYVVGVTACIRGADVPTDLPPCLPSSSETDRSLSKGSTAIIGPDGDMLARPLIAEAGFVYADWTPTAHAPRANSSTPSATTAAATSCT